MKVGDTVEFTCEGQHYIGTLGRIVKMAARCVPSDDPDVWTAHVEVEGDYRKGTYSIPYRTLSKLGKGSDVE